MNKYKTLTIIFLCFFGFLLSQEDTTFVTAHDYVDMDSHGNFDNWAVFPDGSTSYRKVLMHYDLRCGSPDNPTWPGCSGWDYTTKISLLKQGGLDDYGNPFFIHDQTLANVVTPYGTYMQVGNSQGSGFSPEWVQRYTYDVTDFAPLLRDSVLLRAFYGGWPQSSAPGCFNVTLNFEFIEGVPPRNVLSVHDIWSGSNSYASLQDVLSDTLFFIPEEAVNSMMRVTISGHGQDGEFTDGVYYHVKLDNSTLYSQEIWRDDCGEVAIYPQGGTWIYDRANWCPGDKATTREHELTSFITPGEDNLLDFNIYKSNWNPAAASYIYDVQLITYEAPNFVVDAMMEDILAPSNKKEYFRLNPTCSNPIIKIKNQGSESLTNAEIIYGFEGFEVNTYSWEGNLLFGESEVIYLPPINWPSWDDSIPFYAEVSVSGDDLNIYNNRLLSDYEFVEEYPNTFAMWFKTNNVPNESSYELTDNQGNLIFSKTGMSANTIYKDTFELEPGCYKLQILDTGGNQYANEDGLSWWANNDGSGYARLRNIPGGFFQYYQDDFGTELTDYFRVGDYSVGLSDKLVEPIIEIYPNPTQDKLIVDLELLSNSDIDVLFTDLSGKILKKISKKDFSLGIIELDLHVFNNGIYNCTIKTHDKTYNRKVVIVK